ncbi:MAG: hypothetical protein LBJ63_01780 [Prevotellaceae bacterium]|jgi:hypothetical protein|nr:hypothetical protein [Prevotellaceae bacterium]
MKRKILIVVAACIGMIMFSACSQNKMKLDINAEAGTFGFVDVNSGMRLSYDKLIINGKEVVDTHCSGGSAMTGKSVTFAFNRGDIIRNGNSVTTTGDTYTEYAVLKYKLENGVLTILGID